MDSNQSIASSLWKDTDYQFLTDCAVEVVWQKYFGLKKVYVLHFHNV